MPREALIPLLLGRSGEEQSEREEADDMSMNRRQFSGGLVGLAAAAGLSQIQIPAKVDSAHIQFPHSSVEKLVTQDQSVGGGALVRDGLRLYHRARRMLDEADYSEATGRQLMNTTGELAVCVGWLAYDADDQYLSRELYAEARMLAGQSGDDGLAMRAMEKSAMYFVQKRTSLAARAKLCGSVSGPPNWHAMIRPHNCIPCLRPAWLPPTQPLAIARGSLSRSPGHGEKWIVDSPMTGRCGCGLLIAQKLRYRKLSAACA